MQLKPMTAARYQAYRLAAEVDYAHNIAASGATPESEAREKAREDFGRLLAEGLDTPGHHLWVAYDGEEEVGVLWLHVEQRSDGLHAFGYDFSVRRDVRRHGYGRAIVVAAEQVCREMGVVSVGLSVFGFNLGARSLYEQMGFEISAIQMRKRL
ncbi:hypothetical protein GCM10009835_14750 [Planosporangium flavigriseum]|uniref:N-acetyltransferase domain-containing protein n=1 Tax=Planosporangium flavigriseum TaxID=373681 RepID=A0A8J3PP97_9ACTN|nr:hypothetical protein Pfl04_32200 [Planosporangium flavigriseum]